MVDDLQKIGSQTYFTKAIIYAPMEVELFPPHDYKKAIKKLKADLKKSPHHKYRSLFKHYVPDNESSVNPERHQL